MPTYRVFGTKYQNYYTIIEAADSFEAVDKANSLSELEWNSVPTDDVIEATDVFLDEDTEIDLQVNM